MTLPPPPEPFGSQPPAGGGQSGGGVPPQWGPQQGYGGYGPPPQGQWGPGGPPQGPWGPAGPGGPGGQPPKGGKSKWILGGVAVVLAIALAVVITVLVVRPSDGGGGNGSDPTAQNGNSEFASANDTGPVNIITEDPTCAAWGKVAREYAAESEAVNWGERDDSIPASAWTPEQKRMYEQVGGAVVTAADRTRQLIAQTPHRVMRELYQQFSVYARAFDDAIPTYTVTDRGLAIVADTLTTAIANICSAVDYGSAPAVAPLVPNPPQPSQVPSIAALDPNERFLTEPNEVCSDWDATAKNFSDETAAWRAVDPDLSASEWTPEQKAVNDAAVTAINRNADELRELGRRSKNSQLADFADLAAQYQVALALAIPTWSPPDTFLSQSATHLVRAVNSACKAVS